MHVLPSLYAGYIVSVRRMVMKSPHGRDGTFGPNVSERSSYSRKELPGSNDNLTNAMVLALANRNVGRVARTNFSQVMFRVIY